MTRSSHLGPAEDDLAHLATVLALHLIVSLPRAPGLRDLPSCGLWFEISHLEVNPMDQALVPSCDDESDCSSLDQIFFFDQIRRDQAACHGLACGWDGRGSVGKGEGS